MFAGIDLQTYDVKMPVARLPATTVVVDLGESCSMISPRDSADDYPDRVTDIVAPNLCHSIGIRAARGAFPHAALWGMRGCRQKLVDFMRLGAAIDWPRSLLAEPRERCID